jgi:hypothetical protein
MRLAKSSDNAVKGLPAPAEAGAHYPLLALSSRKSFIGNDLLCDTPAAGNRDLPCHPLASGVNFCLLSRWGHVYGNQPEVQP